MEILTIAVFKCIHERVSGKPASSVSIVVALDGSHLGSIRLLRKDPVLLVIGLVVPLVVRSVGRYCSL